MTEINDQWTILLPANVDKVVKNAACDLQKYLSEAKHVQVRLGSLKEHPAISGSVLIRIADKDEAVTLGLTVPESHLLRINNDSIEVIGVDIRGTMYGVFYLEQLLDLAKGTKLEPRTEVRVPRFRYRLCTDPYMKFTEDHIDYLAHIGTNIFHIWNICHLEELDPSPVLPHGTKIGYGNSIVEIKRNPQKIAEINRAFELAKRYGMDCYLMIRGTRPFPSTYEAFTGEAEDQARALPPDVLGSNLFLDGIGVFHHQPGMTPPCISSQTYRKFIYESCQNLVRALPDLKGIIVEPIDSCLWCDDTCDRCRERPLAARMVEYIHLLRDAARSVRPDIQMALYAWGFPFDDLEGRDILIKNLAPDTIIIGTYADGLHQFVDGEFLHRCTHWDETLVAGPGDTFLADCARAASTGKTYGGWITLLGSNDYPWVPYLPAPYVYKDQLNAIKDAGGTLLFEHGGPHRGLAADVLRSVVWDSPEVTDQYLEQLAIRDFGPEAAPIALRAWRVLGEAANKRPTGYYYLYWMYQTPTTPIYATKEPYEFLYLTHKVANIVSLTQFQSFSDSYLKKLINFYERNAEGLLEGVQLLQQALDKVGPARNRDKALEQLQFAQACYLVTRSNIHFLKMYEAVRTDPIGQREVMIALMAEEIEDIKVYITLLQQNSAIGWNYWTGWIHTPEKLALKIKAQEILAENLRNEIYARTDLTL